MTAPTDLTFAQLCTDAGFAEARILTALTDIPQHDQDQTEPLIRALFARYAPDLVSYAGVFAEALAGEYDAAIEDGQPIAGSRVRSSDYGRGVVIQVWRNSGALGGWNIRARYGDRTITCIDKRIEWVGGIARPAMLIAAE